MSTDYTWHQAVMTSVRHLGPTGAAVDVDLLAAHVQAGPGPKYTTADVRRYAGELVDAGELLAVDRHWRQGHPTTVALAGTVHGRTLALTSAARTTVRASGGRTTALAWLAAWLATEYPQVADQARLAAEGVRP